MNGAPQKEPKRVSIASLAHLRDFAGFVEGSATWDFDGHVDLANKKRNREKRKHARLLRGERLLVDLL